MKGGTRALSVQWKQKGGVYVKTKKNKRKKNHRVWQKEAGGSRFVERSAMEAPWVQDNELLARETIKEVSGRLGCKNLPNARKNIPKNYHFGEHVWVFLKAAERKQKKREKREMRGKRKKVKKSGNRGAGLNERANRQGKAMSQLKKKKGNTSRQSAEIHKKKR